MAILWIVHREARARAALARLAGATQALVGAPADPRFETATPPRLVVLGVSADFEAELEFAHRFLPRVGEAAWLLVSEAADLSEARRLFDALPAELLRFPPTARLLQQRLREALGRRSAESLSERRVRDAVAERFARCFRDLELPELLAALDPRLAQVPLLIRGEPGTGRTLLARYVHLFGAGPEGAGPFVSLACERTTPEARILAGVVRAARAAGGSGRATLCLEEVDRLPVALQQELCGWIELAPPGGAPRAVRLRWIATADERDSGDPGRELDAGLEQILGGVSLRLPPLRLRPEAIGAMVEETAGAWGRLRGERPRRFSAAALEALREYPWPGNFRELHAVVVRTLAAESADPLEAEQLRFAADAAPGPLPGPVETDSGPIRAEPEPLFVEAPAPGEGELEAAELEEGAVEEAELEAAEVVPEPQPAAERLAEPETHPPAGEPAAQPSLRRIAGAVAHEVRNPLAAIRTFAGLLPERYQDPEFRRRFAEVVGGDAERIQAVVDRLARFASLAQPRAARVDVAELLDGLLEERRPAIETRRLLVLKELDRAEPAAWADPDQLRFALDALLERVLALVPERGDLYLASKHHPTGLRGGPCVRVLLRLQRPPGSRASTVEGLGLEETALELPIAEAVIRSQGGSVTLDASRPEEALILLDLPAPRASA